MSRKILPSNPNIDQYRKQAKDLVKEYKAGEPQTILRIKQHHPRFATLSQTELSNEKFLLADAQLIVAREHGFESWPKFAKHIESLRTESSQAALWRSADDAVVSGDALLLESCFHEMSRFFEVAGRDLQYRPTG